MSIRLHQNSETKPFRPEVRLVSMTSNPVGTIFALWYGSRHSDRVKAYAIQYLYDMGRQGVMLSNLAGVDRHLAEKICKSYPEHAGENGEDYFNVIQKIVEQVIQADLPPSESVLFTFEIDKANVAWREQLVRSKVASYWTQTSRTQDLTTMDVNMSDSIPLIGGEEAVEIYEDTVETIREAYKKLTSLGIPMEDIRLQPQGHTHRVYWMINLRSLVKILNKRSDWIAQASLWTPVIAGVCSELRDLGMDSILKNFIGKPFPVLSRDKDGNLYVSEHAQVTENEDRYYGRDPIPCDPLYLAYTGKEMPEHTNIEFYDYMKSMFIHIWGDEYLEVLGWRRDNPDQLGPYDRPFGY